MGRWGGEGGTGVDVGNAGHGTGAEGPGESGVKVLDLGKGDGREVVGLGGIKMQDWKREEGGREEGQGDVSDLRPPAGAETGSSAGEWRVNLESQSLRFLRALDGKNNTTTLS